LQGFVQYPTAVPAAVQTSEGPGQRENPEQLAYDVPPHLPSTQGWLQQSASIMHPGAVAVHLLPHCAYPWSHASEHEELAGVAPVHFEEP
jgi:hypothetical protein